MSKISLLAFSALLLFLYSEGVAADEAQQKGNDDNPKYAPLWFGPRVGRRKRNLVEDGYKGGEDLEDLLEMIRKSQWAIVLFNNGRSRYIDFDPKSSSDEEQITNLVQRSMFAPRLGRSMFAPRLGRGALEGSME